ncbi:MAG: TonB-dependent receptor [Geminicoccaceae bacterium]
MRTRPVAIGLLVFAAGWSPAAAGAEDCPPERPRVGTVLAVEGGARVGGKRDVAPGQPICAGETVAVARDGRASVQLPEASTVLRLDGGAQLTVEAPDAPGSGRVRLLEGVLYFLSQVRRSLTVETPYVTAGIDGTEVLVEVGPGAAELLVLDGAVRLRGAGQANAAPPLRAGETARVLADGRLERAGAPAAPGEALRATARDRLGWTLWYPPIVEAEAARYPDLAEAARALAAGRIERLRAFLARPAAGEEKGLFRALEAIVATARGELEEAAAAAREAVALAPEAAGPRIAWSYVRQARGDLEGARAHLEIALRLAPESALVRARAAELAFMRGELRTARREAERALERADTALGHLVLGFVELAASRPSAAVARFETARARDPGNPSVHLGLGLARIREGRLEEGKAAIEAAAALDPTGALSRSYLGRALAAVGRPEKAREQLELAKGLDPDDPTPWLATAILELEANRPAAALAELDQAIARNRGREPFRSRTLLEQDRATQSAALARIYRELGLETPARLQAQEALARDPGNAAAHRFLADLFADRQRYQVARTSEQLQAQLAGPLEAEPVSPRLGFGDLSIAPGAAALFPGYGEYGFAFERERVTALGTAVVGGSETVAGEALVGALAGRAALSAGLLSSRTDGFRDDARIDNDLANLVGRFQVDETLQLQIEGRRRATERGDIVQRFARDVFAPDADNRLTQNLGRVGAAWRPRPETLALGSLMAIDQREENSRLGAPNSTQESLGWLGELQLQEQVSATTRLVLGGGFTRIDLENDFFGVVRDEERTARNAYLYATGELLPTLRLTLGLSVDSYRSQRHDIDTLDPKIGLDWRPTDGLAFRAAALRTVKRPLLVDQTLEPTQVAGFTQLFDDVNGTEAWLLGLGFDWRLGRALHAGAQLTWRSLTVPTLIDGEPVFDDQDEYRLEGYLAWQVHPELTVSLEPTVERFDVASGEVPRYPQRADSIILPLRLRWVAPSGLFGEARLSLVHQIVEDYLPAGVEEGDSTFATLDAAVGWRLPGQRGSIALVATNILDKDFDYLDDNYRTNEVRLGAFVPETTVLLRGTLRF